MSDYAPILPADPDIPAGTKIDTSHPQYAAAVEAARAAKLTQAQFTALLGHEVRRVMQSRKSAPPPAAPKPAPIPGYAQMTMRQKLAARDARGIKS